MGSKGNTGERERVEREGENAKQRVKVKRRRHREKEMEMMIRRDSKMGKRNGGDGAKRERKRWTRRSRK